MSMKNKMGLKRAAAAATAAATIAVNVLAVPVFASNGTPAWNTQGGQETVHGDTYLIEPVVEVELPGDLTFGVNPLKLNVSEDPTKPDKAQIVSGTYLVTNYSDVPVAVSAVTKITASADVDLKTKTLATTDWDKDNKQLKKVEGKKAALIVQSYPKTIDNEGNMTKSSTIDPGATPAASAITGDILTADAPDTTVYFVLNAFDDTKASESMGGFQFDGAVDPNAAFTENDIKVSTTFTMDIITEDQKKNNYDAYTTNGGNNKGPFFSTIKKKKP